jgi:hypothetical protein
MSETFTLTVDADKVADDLMAINGRKNQGVMAMMFGADPQDVLEIAVDIVNQLHHLVMEMLGDDNIKRVVELQEAQLVLEEAD